MAAILGVGTLVALECAPAPAQVLSLEKPQTPAGFVQRVRARRNAEAAPAPAAKKKAEKPELPQMAFAVVSLAQQRVSIYGADGLITRSSVSTGQAGHRTPTGIFTILEKQRWHESNIYSGAPMPFMQRITWSGVAMHEGIVPGYPASHGCIRLPAAFAAKLWTMTKPGTRVIIAANDLQPFEFAHPLLPVPKMVPAAELVAADAAPAPVTLASNDPQAPAKLVAAEDGDRPLSEHPAMLNPFEVAHAMKARAGADAVRARKAADQALVLARTSAAEADAAAADLKAARADVERTRARSVVARADLEETKKAAASVAAAAPADAAQPIEQASSFVSSASAAPAAGSERVEAAAARLAAVENDLVAADARLAAAKSADDLKGPRAYELASAARAAEKAAEAAQDAIQEARRRQLPVNIVVSRKEGMLLVRQGFKAVYEAPIAIAEPERPLGTHIFIAIEGSGDAAGLDWAAMTVPVSGDEGERKAKPRKGRAEPAVETPRLEPSGPEEALERIQMPDSAKQAIAELIWVGGSLVITDRGLSNESGEHTDLNVALP